MIESRWHDDVTHPVEMLELRSTGILKDEGPDLVGPSVSSSKKNMSHHLRTSFHIGLLTVGVNFAEHDGRPSNEKCFTRGTY